MLSQNVSYHFIHPFIDSPIHLSNTQLKYLIHSIYYQLDLSIHLFNYRHYQHVSSIHSFNLQSTFFINSFIQSTIKLFYQFILSIYNQLVLSITYVVSKEYRCQTCIDRLYTSGSAPCPVCKITLR